MSIRINSTFAGGAVIGGIVTGFVFCNLLSSAADADAARIPDFAPDPSISWSLEGRLDDLLPPTSGPSPVTFDPAHAFNPGINYRVADLSNPILQPWAKERMKKSNDEVLAGKVPFRARSAAGRSAFPGSSPTRQSPRSISFRRRKW